MKSILWIWIFGILCDSFEAEMRNFPKGFLFGVASSAYQIEGAWNQSGKGENIWDHLTHTRPHIVKGRTNADEAAKSYEYYMRDIEAVQNLGVDFYRFSLSWSRIFPTGFINSTNPEGVQYYNTLIDSLLAKNIIPYVTIYHWDLPQKLQEIGGWVNPDMVDIFADYARFCYETFGDRVKMWLTMNEPKETCALGYGDTRMAPALGIPGTDYICGHTTLKAHAKAYHIYDKEFRPTQKGRIGITMTVIYYHPGYETQQAIDAVSRRSAFEIGWFANPIFGKDGDYPQLMKDTVAERSREIGLPKSRLPELTKSEVEMIKGTSDFFGINHYTSNAVGPLSRGSTVPSYEDDHRTRTWQNWWWTASASFWLRVAPWGFRKVLNYLNDVYGKPEIIVFENGLSTFKNNLDDYDRVEFIENYINSMLDAIDHDNINVTAYTAWSLMDSFEWDHGYKATFGLHAVDFSDPKRSITPKESAKYYTKVVKSKQIPRPKGKDFTTMFSLDFVEKFIVSVRDRVMETVLPLFETN